MTTIDDGTICKWCDKSQMYHYMTLGLAGPTWRCKGGRTSFEPAMPNSSPLGIMPEFIWRQKRLVSLIQACSRYADAGLLFQPQVSEWLLEATGHQTWLASRKQLQSEQS